MTIFLLYVVVIDVLSYDIEKVMYIYQLIMLKEKRKIISNIPFDEMAYQILPNNHFQIMQPKRAMHYLSQKLQEWTQTLYDSRSQIKNNKKHDSPCYIAARGAGVKNKIILAAKHFHAAVAEYIVNVTQRGLIVEEVNNSKNNILFFFCASVQSFYADFVPYSTGVPVLHLLRMFIRVIKVSIELCGSDFDDFVPRKVDTPLDLAKASNDQQLLIIENK
ncbi:hypothetical protein BDC45DRAFT_533362 [Circinella umbellata]|nr:hypothetical protein BDC45DRAFT_533362 [Circinella umbellata]